MTASVDYAAYQAERVKKFLSYEVSSDEETPQRPRHVALSESPVSPQPFRQISAHSQICSHSTSQLKSVGPIEKDNTTDPIYATGEANPPTTSVSVKGAQTMERGNEMSSTAAGSYHECSESPSVSLCKLPIYERSKRQAAIAAERIQHLRNKMEVARQEDHTFKPVISRRAMLLKRSPLDSVESVEAYQQRLRDHIFNSYLANNECTFKPKVCQRSSKIVSRQRRSRGVTTVCERLYHNQQKTDSSMPSARPPHTVRTPKQIEEHVASLYDFQARKEELLLLLREQQHSSLDHSLYVDPATVVARLCQPKLNMDELPLFEESLPTPPTRSLLAKKNHLFYVQRRKDRSLRSWFHLFSKGELQLSARVLDEQFSMHSLAGRALHVLQKYSRQTSWTEEEFVSIICNYGEAENFPLWRFQPDAPDVMKCSKEMYSFHPRVDRVSEAIVSRKGERSSANDRLYYSARTTQLSLHQSKLEEEQRWLKEEEEKYVRRQRLQHEWRRISTSALSAKNAGPNTNADEVVASGRLAPATSTTSLHDSSTPFPTSSERSVAYVEQIEPLLARHDTDRSAEEEVAPQISEVSHEERRCNDDLTSPPPHSSKRSITHNMKSILAVEALEKVLSELEVTPDAPSDCPVVLDENSSHDDDMSSGISDTKRVSSSSSSSPPPPPPLSHSAVLLLEEHREGARINNNKRREPTIEDTSIVHNNGACQSNDFFVKYSLCCYPRMNNHLEAEQERKKRLKELGRALYRENKEKNRLK